MSKRVCSSEEVANNITESCFVFFICNSNSPSNTASWSKMERRNLIGSLSGSNLQHRRLRCTVHELLKTKSQFFVCFLTSYLVDKLNLILTAATWIEAQSTWNTHLPRCTCRFFRLLIKDGCTYMCRILKCLYMKLNGGSRVHRWRTHRYLWVIRNRAEERNKHELCCTLSQKVFSVLKWGVFVGSTLVVLYRKFGGTCRE